GVGPWQVAVGDLNGDGKQDLVVADGGTGSGGNYGGVQVFLNLGNGTFGNAISSPAGHYPVAVTVADFNHDGKQDVAAGALGDLARDPGGLTLLPGQGNGSFAGSLSFAAGPSPGALAAADLNADGNLDLAVVNQANGTLTVLPGNGDGSFGAAVYATGQAPG